MANNPFDRTIINFREKPLSSDIDRAQSQADYSMRFMMRELFAKRAETLLPASANSNPATGFVGTGFRVTPAGSPNMTVTVKSGLGMYDDPANVPSAIGGVIGVDDLSPYKPIVLMQDKVFTVPTAPGANTRLDLIEVRYNRVSTDPQTRLILDANTGAFSPNVVQKTLENTVDGSVGSVTSPAPSTAALSYKQGVAAASPVVPATTPGYVAVAVVLVGTSVTSIGAASISDMRSLLFPGGVAAWSGAWRITWNAGAPTATCLRLNMPPGVTAVMDPQLAQRGACNLYVAGGLMQGSAVTATIGSIVAPGAGEHLVLQRDLGFVVDPSNVYGGVAIGSPLSGVFTTGVPSSPLGPQSNYATARLRPSFQSGATTNVTSVLLEDILVDVTGAIRW